MNILYVAATEFEIAPFLKQKPAADFLITGVGVPLAIYHITKRLQQIDYDLVIQAGIAGSFTTSQPLGKVVFVNKDNFADIGISEKNIFSSMFEKGFMDENEFPFTKSWLENPEKLMDLFPLEKMNAVTVNMVTDNADHINMLKSKFHAQLETMEGAALHFTCLLEKIPFIQLRSISNYVGERDKTKWEMKKAIENLNKTLLNITEHLTTQHQTSNPKQ
ncbi:MAG: futalosine hydrolase [Ferruginibacter sp.]